MTKKLLVYNMPEDVLRRINQFSEKYKFKTLVAEDYHLHHNVGDLLEEKFDLQEERNKDLEKIDINFLMIHNFSDKELDELLKDFREEALNIPNKCISTDTNKGWILHDLLKENKEESELMPILHGLYSLKKVGNKLLEEGIEDKEIEDGISEINAYIEKKDFDKEPMKDLYNRVAKVINKHLQ